MDGKTISQALESDKFCKNIFQGIYSQDTVDHILPNKCIIFNTSLSTDPVGEHWITILNLRPNVIAFLCSYKTSPEDYPPIFDLLKASGKKIYVLPRRLQGDITSVCGCYSLWFVFLASRHFTPGEMMRQFFPLPPPHPSSTRRKSYNKYEYDMFVSIVTREIFKIKAGVPKLLYNQNFIKAQDRQHGTHT